MQPFWQELVVGLIVASFIILLIRILMKGGIEIYKQYNETERIRRLPQCFKKGQIMVKRQGQEGTYQIIACHNISFEYEESEVGRSSDETDKRAPCEI